MINGLDVKSEVSRVKLNKKDLAGFRKFEEFIKDVKKKGKEKESNK